MKKILLLLLCVTLFGCEEEKQPDPRKKYNYHVFLRSFDDKKVFYTGSTIGLSSCGIIGRRALAERKTQELAGKEWEVICCWYTKPSQCNEEHHYQDKNIPYEEWKNDLKYHPKPSRSYVFR